MKRNLVLVLTALLIFGIAGSASATAFSTPTNLYNLLSKNGDAYDAETGLSKYKDTGAEYISNDIDTDSTVFLMLEMAGFKQTNTLGIYGFNADGSLTGETLEIFKGTASANSSKTLAFNLTTGEVWLTSNPSVKAVIGTTFGFYLKTIEQDANGDGKAEEHIFYTHAALNGDGYDHALIYDTDDNSEDCLNGADTVIAFEDWYGATDNDWDFDDMVVGISDTNAAPVPEPATLLLLGSGMIGLAGFRKKKQ